MMTVAMAGLNYGACFIYLEYLIVFGNSLQNHNENVLKVLERLRQTNLKLNPGKCELKKKEILYLGNIISAEGILPDPEKTNVMSRYPVPTTADECKRFVAFVNYYRRFIKKFAGITQPLNNLTRKGVEFKWTTGCNESFEKLKAMLVRPPLLQYPDFPPENEFILRTVASGTDLGCVLSNSDDGPSSSSQAYTVNC